LIGTRIRRRALLVRRHGGAPPIAEIDLDSVEFFHPGEVVAAGGRFHEVEVELLGGDESDLERLVRCLRRRYELRPSRLSKLERALQWAGIPVPRLRRRR
jgi:inorganic triphosphatase YgiF